MNAASPAERLAASREHLRLALLEAGAKRHTGGPDAARATTDSGAGGSVAWESLPGVKLVIEAIGLWWDKHPLRASALLATEAARTVIAPLALRHPLWLVAGAFAAGGLLAWARPWHWGLKSALFAGLLPQLLATALAQLRQYAEAAGPAPIEPSKNP